ncbi:MAG: hypothetical protein WBN40_03440 [Pseudomonadales bacterium]
MRKPLTLLCLSLTLPVAFTAHAAVVQVDPTTLTASNVVDFEDLGVPLGTLVGYNGTLVSGGVSFSERFAGQAVVEVSYYDTLTGAPVSPLTLAANGLPGKNLTVGNLGGNTGLSGESSVMSLGEGAVAVLFTDDQSQVAFDVLGIDLDGGIGGTLFADIWARDGSLLNSFSIVMTGASALSFGFQTDDAAFEIAGITLASDDSGGVGYDNFIYDIASTSQVPLPPAMLLFGSALLGLGATKRRSV